MLSSRRFVLRRAPAIRAFASLPKYFGQPMHETHPHIIPDPTHLVRGIPKSEFAVRRKALAKQFEGSTLVFVSAAERKSSHDTSMKFRQDSTFSYLFGFHEPGAVALMKENGEFHLFCRKSDPLKELWDGARCGVHRAVDAFGAESAYSLEELETGKLKEITGDVDRLILVNKDSFYKNHIDLELLNVVERALDYKSPVVPADSKAKHRLALQACDNLRVIKSSGELQTILEAGSVTLAALEELHGSHPYSNEQITKTILEAKFNLPDFADGPFFDTIVAGGPRACTLHYTACDVPIDPANLLLIDCGARVKSGYGADCTRTLFTDEAYTGAQRVVVGIVQDVQNRVLRSVKAGVTQFQLQELTTQAFLEHLEHNLGIIDGSLSQEDKIKRVRKYYPHGVSHFVGLDVHDTPTVSRTTPLPVNSVVTVEPGLYFPVDDVSLPSALRGIGVRIEDTVVVLHDRCQIVTRVGSADDRDALKDYPEEFIYNRVQIAGH